MKGYRKWVQSLHDPHSATHAVMAMFIFVSPLLLIWAAAFSSEITREFEANAIRLFIPQAKRTPPDVVRGIYLTAYTAGSDARRTALFGLVDRTELNAIVIDIKNGKGEIAYDTNLLFARQHGLVSEAPYDLRDILRDAHRRDIWTIARFPIFEDPALAKARPDLALRTIGGGTWKTRRGTAWVDPTNREVWQYVADLARDALSHGFDEVQFDYIRFPSDGALGDAVYANLPEGTEKYQLIAQFFRFLRSDLGDDAYLSVDLFGLTMDAASFPDSDLRIGQRLRDATPALNVISPMVYASHYHPGYAGFTNPAAYPGEVVAASLDAATTFLKGDYGQIRPWLQDFDLGAIYTPAMVRAQIDVVEERSADGWLLWNPSNVYSEEALRPQEN